jgi:hypothetical protein
MRIIYRSWLVPGLLLVLACACNPQPPETEAIPTVTPTKAIPTPTKDVVLTSPATSSPLETPAPTPAPAIPPLPDNWLMINSEDIGLQMGMPDNWINAADGETSVNWQNGVEARSLLLATSEATIERLSNGEALDGGAFVIALITKTLITPELATQSPRATLETILLARDNTIGNRPLIKVVANPVLAGAYVDVSQDPFNLLPAPVTANLQMRLALFALPEKRLHVIVLQGAPAEQWAEYDQIFTTMLSTVGADNVDLVTILGNLANGDVVTGQLARAGTDIWSFTASDGRYATVTLTPGSSSIDLTLTLLDAAGQPLETVDNGYAGDKEVLADALVQPGMTYFIEVKEFFEEAGSYELALIMTDEPKFGGGGRLAMSEQVTGNLPPNARHIWTFAGTAGQVVTIILTPIEQQLDLILGLSGPDGQPAMRPLDEGFSGDPEVLVGFVLPITGEYTILVYGFAGHGGRYTVSLDEGGESTINFWEAGDLAYGQSQREVLRADEAHAWFFDGRAGDEVIIVVTPLNERMDMDLWLLDPNVHKLIMKDEFLSGAKETIAFTLPVDGQFIILVREFFGEAGAYEISLTTGGGNFVESMGALTYGVPVSGDLTPGKRAAWTFDGRQGDIITVDLAPLTQTSDLVIVLKRPDGVTVATIDDTLAGMAERLYAFALPVTGQWTLIVQEFFDDGARYTLTVTK